MEYEQYEWIQLVLCLEWSACTVQTSLPFLQKQ